MKCLLWNTCQHRFLCCSYCNDKKCEVRCEDSCKNCRWFVDEEFSKGNDGEFEIDDKTPPVKYTKPIPVVFKTVDFKSKKIESEKEIFEKAKEKIAAKKREAKPR